MNAQTSIQKQARKERHAICQIHLGLSSPPWCQLGESYPLEGWNLEFDPEINERNYRKMIRGVLLGQKLGFERYTVSVWGRISAYKA
jgi:hypothetical protein